MSVTMLLYLFACASEGATAISDTSAQPTFHGQFWTLRAYQPALPWPDVCTRPAKAKEICPNDMCPLADCCVCASLPLDGPAAITWGDVERVPYIGAVCKKFKNTYDLGAWELTDTADGLAVYLVGDDVWEVQDQDWDLQDNTGGWSTRAFISVNHAESILAYQPSVTGSFKSICTSGPIP